MEQKYLAFLNFLEQKLRLSDVLILGCPGLNVLTLFLIYDPRIRQLLQKHVYDGQNYNFSLLKHLVSLMPWLILGELIFFRCECYWNAKDFFFGPDNISIESNCAHQLHEKSKGHLFCPPYAWVLSCQLASYSYVTCCCSVAMRGNFRFIILFWAGCLIAINLYG